MKKFYLLILITFNVHAKLTCTDIQNNYSQIKVLREVTNLLTSTNWNQFAVISEFDQKKCLATTDQQLITLNGEYFWRFKTTEDVCDGGNIYGVIYSYNLKKPMAHIYDGDINCDF